MSGPSELNICFFGLNRSLSLTIDSINRYIFDSLESLDIKFATFGSFVRVDSFSNPRSDELNSIPQDNEAELINFNFLKCVDQGVIDDFIDWSSVFRYGDLYHEIDGSPVSLNASSSSTKNIFRSLFSLKTAYSLIPDNRIKLPTIFIRPDLEILSEIDFNLYLSFLSRKPLKLAYGDTDGVAVVPGWHSWGGLNDRFAICSPGNASSSYANRFDHLLHYLEISRHPLHSETFLYQLMHASRVDVYPIVSTLMTRIRAEGRPQQEDFLNYSGLRQDLSPKAMQNKSLLSLHDIIQDKDRENKRVKDESKRLIEDLNQQLCESHAVKDEAQRLNQQLHQQISEKTLELQTLKQEAQRTIDGLNRELVEKSVALDNVKEETAKLLEESYQQFLSKSDELRSVKSHCDSQAASIEGLKIKIQDCQNQYKLLEVSTKNSHLNLEADKAFLASNVETLKEDNELLLLQLHQVQIDLERSCAISEKKSKILESNIQLQKKIANLYQNGFI